MPSHDVHVIGKRNKDMVEIENEKMETEPVMHVIKAGDVLSKCEQFFITFKASSGKEVYVLLNNKRLME